MVTNEDRVQHGRHISETAAFRHAEARAKLHLETAIQEAAQGDASNRAETPTTSNVTKSFCNAICGLSPVTAQYAHSPSTSSSDDLSSLSDGTTNEGKRPSTDQTPDHEDRKAPPRSYAATASTPAPRPEQGSKVLRADAEPFVMDESWEQVKQRGKRSSKQSPSSSSGSTQSKPSPRNPKKAPAARPTQPRQRRSQPAAKSPSSSSQSSSAPPRSRRGKQAGQLNVDMTSQPATRVHPKDRAQRATTQSQAHKPKGQDFRKGGKNH